MEYVDRQQGIHLTQEDLNAIDNIINYITHSTDKEWQWEDILILSVKCKKAYLAGLKVEQLKTEYAGLPLEWVLKLYS